MLIGYLTCNYSFTLFDGKVVEKGPCVLLLRRGFSVSAMTGQWSVNAGVDDIVEDGLGVEERQSFRMFDEVVDETGVPPGRITNITCIGHRNQPNLDKAGQTFKQTLFWLEAKPIDRVALCYEHTGAIWMPLVAIRHYLELGETEDKELRVILKDGVVPGFWEGMRMLCSAVFAVEHVQ